MRERGREGGREEGREREWEGGRERERERKERRRDRRRDDRQKTDRQTDRLRDITGTIPPALFVFYFFVFLVKETTYCCRNFPRTTSLQADFQRAIPYSRRIASLFEAMLLQVLCTQFPCFTITKVQILTYVYFRCCSVSSNRSNSPQKQTLQPPFANGDEDHCSRKTGPQGFAPATNSASSFTGMH